MNNQQQNNASQTDAKKVRRQNAASAQNQSQQTEFASETDAQEVRRQNQQSEQKKNQNQQQQ
ncbi:gamma-type small acid-soluble spore protein [Salibacterium lacus]|uniref:Small, acid-soluble spore protein gamma-type n=1 Tax=Salibacterium lacus TaxID=1898109 RepID=A0ABW5SX15_9BACI